MILGNFRSQKHQLLELISFKLNHLLNSLSYSILLTIEYDCCDGALITKYGKQNSVVTQGVVTIIVIYWQALWIFSTLVYVQAGKGNPISFLTHLLDLYTLLYQQLPVCCQYHHAQVTTKSAWIVLSVQLILISQY